MRELIQSTAENVMVFMVLSSDSKTGATGKTLTIEISKNGGAFSSISPTVTERADGWYNIALTSSHTDTLGDLAIHIEAADCDPSDLMRPVVAGASGLRHINVHGLTDDVVSAAKFDAGAIDVNAVASALLSAIADVVLRRQMPNVEASSNGDTLNIGSLYGLVQQAQESNTVDNAGKLTVYRTDGTTELAQKTISTSATAEPVNGIS